MPIDIQQALQRYNPIEFKDYLEAAERERTAILGRFPLQHWPVMPLEEYALGQDMPAEQLYSWWLEYGTNHLGSVRGGSARKHNIYRAKDGNWNYRSEYSSEQEAWGKLRQAFVSMFEYARADRWLEIDDIEGLYGTRSVRVKTLHVYFPEKILPVASHSHLQYYLSQLQVPRSEYRHLEVVSLNRLLLEKMREFPETKQWTTNEIERFLYWWNDPREETRGPQIVKIAAGEEGSLWQDCFENGYIRIGWDKVSNLREYVDESEFRADFEDKYLDEYKGNRATLRRKADEVWTLNSLEPGDIIVANKGVTAVLGIGTVIEPGYEWLPNVDKFQHAVRVKWDTTHAGEKALPDQWRFVTVAPVSQELYQRIIGATIEEVATKIPSSPLFAPIADALERKGQVIMHGPPGTGKTYHALRFAEWWLARENGRALDASKARQTPRRVWWIVANQKQWHWDNLFRDGSVEYRYGRLMKNYSLVQEGDLVIGYLAAPEKRVVALAKVKQGLHDSGGESHITLEPVHRVENGLTYAELIEDPVLRTSEPARFRCQGTLFKLEDNEAEYLFSLLAERDAQVEEYIDKTDTSVNADNQLTLVTFHPSYSYEDFIEGFRPQDSGDGLRLRLTDGLFKTICTTAHTNPDRKYLIIVDEINRANLAKVFGEIITLLERDKRGISVVLPQSKEAFSIPQNVYMLGTMNTSDRSIRLMDAALRRRFSFVEIMPDLALLRGAQIEARLDLYDFLNVLNTRISRTLGREKQIGHSFFLEGGEPISDTVEFARRFRQDVLPLLQEYCYDDYGQLAEYVGQGIVDIENGVLRTDVLYDDDRLIAALTDFTASASGTTQ